ncbi:MAG: TonB-dependent receptor [Lunatimonas sp.]|uniref:SusC/RagA family TonB-linked outer membrane protein n=1 Tax=Lunatimonas sp. TaxID=2060141 RepID=UPI00263AE1DA|nr:TonB-dependent receptor [Lunatimonas sp.]MCC5938318.1 TonB-dependent receptor [Lunatimonas sp.]
MKKSVHFPKIWEKCILLMCCVLLAEVAYAQSGSVVRGTVTDSGGESIPGVNVLVKGTSVGTITDIDGGYSINVPQNSSTLVFSFIGYRTVEEALGGRSQINVRLESALSDMEEVVVIGFGEQSREVLTTAITKVDAKALESIPYPNAASALQGTVSGVRVQSTSGQPGAAPRVIVRGGTSINNPNGAAPLYIIDGVIRPDMNDLSADDIENMQVLKDAAATSIYGARASNGVVIITTKSGKAGQTRVTYRYDLTFSEPGKLYEMANARQYLTAYRLGHIRPEKFPDETVRLTLPNGFGTGNDLTNNTAFTTQYLTPENEHKLNEGWESMPDPVDPSRTLIFQDNDIQSLIYQTGVSQNHHVSVQGGTDKATFNAGLGYLSNEGTVITTQYDRLTFNLNGDIQVKDNLSIYGRVLYTYNTTNTTGQSTAVTFYRSAGLAPTTKIYFEDGTLAPGTAANIGNPLYFLNNRVAESTGEKSTYTVGAKWDILPGLSFDPQISMYNINNNSYSFQPGFLNGPLNFVDTRVANASTYQWRQRQADLVLSYGKTFGQSHNLDAKLGFAYFDRNINSMSASGRGASTDLIPTLNASSEPTSVNSSITDQVILGYFGRVNYDFDQKYLFSLNMRYDGASNLGAANKWGFFPGISAGWNLHREEFWQNAIPDNLLRMKLRVSYGENGNIGGLGDFAAQGAYGVGARYAGLPAIQNTIIPNPDLQWEQSRTVNVGTDFSIFDNRLSFIVDVYRRVTDNLITSLPLPQSTGFASVQTNLGSLENTGFEMELSAQVLPRNSRVQWSLGFNASKVKNKILRLPPNGVERNRVGGVLVWDPGAQDYVWKGGLQEGGRLGEMYSRQQIGIYPTDEAAANAPTDMWIVSSDRTKYGGDTEWLDLDGNGIIDSRDQTYMGQQFPVWTGGISNNISYKNFNLYVRMDYTTGHSIFNWARMFLDMNGFGDNNMTVDKYENSWKEQGDIAEYSRFYWGGERVQRNNFNGTTTSGNSVFFESGDFLCVRELTLSYSVPPAIVSKLRLNAIRLNFTGNNLHYFTAYKGLNPEEGGQDDGRYAMPRNYNFGVNVTF